MWNLKLVFVVCYQYIHLTNAASNIFNQIAINKIPKQEPIKTIETNAGERCLSMCLHNEKCQSFLIQEIMPTSFKCLLYDKESQWLELETDTNCRASTFFSNVSFYKFDCLDYYNSGATTDGIYEIYLPSGPKHVFCRMNVTGQGGGWLSIQRRIDGDVNFHRTWQDYKKGFGEVDDEFWLGNEILHYLTSTYPHQFYVRATSFDLTNYISKHDDFLVLNEEQNYRMSASVNSLEGTLQSLQGDNLNQSFSTYDNDNDSWRMGSVAAKYNHGGFWYAAGSNFIPNGNYYNEGSHIVALRQGMCWNRAAGLYESLKSMELMIRRHPIYKLYNFV